MMAHREIDSRNRILGFGIDPSEIDRVGVTAIIDSIGNCEILVIDEVGKFTVESEGFVNSVRHCSTTYLLYLLFTKKVVTLYCRISGGGTTLVYWR